MNPRGKVVAHEQQKQQLIADLAAARGEILAALAALPGEACETIFLGSWSAHDIVAHLIGWDLANLEAIEALGAGRLPAFYAAYDPDWRTFNARLVARHKTAALRDTLEAARASHRVLLNRVAALPVEDLFADTGVRSPGKRRVTVGMLLGAEARDENKHAAQIRAFTASGR